MLRLRTLGGLELLGPDGPVTGAASRRRPLALLAVIAAAGSRGVTRERLVGILWSDSPEEQARHVLSQSLYALRRGLGADELVLDTGVLRLNPAVITSDIAQFNDAIDAGDRSGAIAAYQGSFLDGFYLSGAPLFERWVEEERARIAAKFHQALESEAEEAESTGNHARAAELWNRRVTSDPLATRPLIRLVRALDAAGERGAALRQLRIHRALLEQEGTAVASDVTALERTLQEPAPVSTAPVARAPIAPAVAAPATVVEQTTMAPPRARRLAFLFGSIAVL